MSIEYSRQSQRPYRYGMILLCLGALINWLGLSETDPNAEFLRYIGLSCILGGALLICCSICCCTVHFPSDGDSCVENEDSIYVITVNDPNNGEKPPEYEKVGLPPTYSDAIKLSSKSQSSYEIVVINSTNIVKENSNSDLAGTSNSFTQLNESVSIDIDSVSNCSTLSEKEQNSKNVLQISSTCDDLDLPPPYSNIS